eukprot:CAMPEP_0119060716 /NCGR_PEP_ID=MMETSP1178-20130426/4642_1 /TAXON_ID=33656 /ORGANISM="unid sp, Strain CCMP2000" /LENGTH=139 /DNA_ID=CAMNT_0007041845 /DNA_START=193 /DNA_END=613 /DNA_ORIENTATION=-
MRMEQLHTHRYHSTRREPGDQEHNAFLESQVRWLLVWLGSVYVCAACGRDECHPAVGYIGPAHCAIVHDDELACGDGGALFTIRRKSGAALAAVDIDHLIGKGHLLEVLAALLKPWPVEHIHLLHILAGQVLDLKAGAD